MRWLIIYLLIMAVLWLFMKGSTLRRALMAGVTAVFAVLMVVLVITEKQPGDDAPPPTDQQLSDVRQFEAVRYGALVPSDIAINASSLTNTETVQSDPSGREVVRKNPFEWRLVTSITNRSEKYAARDVGLHVQLYSCPPFFSTPQAEVTLDGLRAACSRIGQRRVGFENIALQPGASHDDERIITFPNQTEASNPRYWIEVQTVSAAATK